MAETGRWPIVKDLVARALEVDAADRRAWLDAQPVPDDVRQEARALVDADARAQGFLDAPALERPGAARVIHEATRAWLPSAAQPGQMLGAYKVLRPLGQGGMGTVYLAVRADEAFEKHVAIKVVSVGAGGTHLADRLREERRLLASLDHPFIARLLDGGTTAEGAPYVVMEYVEGEPIDAYCTAHALPLRARLDLVRRVCAAVQHAHRNLVVHRDLKASNILVTSDGTPKLLDFGIAKALADDRGLRTLTGYGAMTPESASPEQLRGEPVTVATDVWGLGVLLYTLLTGRGPFAHATSPAALTRAICDEDPAPPGRRAGALSIPVDVDLIVKKALAKRPQDRYDTAAALEQDLGRFLDNRPIAAAPDSLAYRARRFAGRHRVGTAVAAATCVALAGGVTATLWQARIAERERARAERRFEEVRQLANTMIFDLHDAIVPLPGSTPARKMLVERALRYLDGLLGEAGQDAGLQRELAAAYERLAVVQGRRGDANLGDAAGARASLEKAETLRRRAAAAPGAGLADRVALAVVYDQRAYLAETRAERLSLVDHGLGVLDALTAEERATEDAARARATLLWNGAAARVEAKDYAGARPMYDEALQGYEHLLAIAAPRQQAQASRNLSIACKNYGALLWVQGEREAAMTLYRRALALDEARLATQPDHTTWRLDLSFSLASLAHAELGTGDVAGSVRHYEQALQLRTLALAADPQNAQAKAAVERGEQTLARARARAREARARKR